MLKPKGIPIRAFQFLMDRIRGNRHSDRNGHGTIS